MKKKKQQTFQIPSSFLSQLQEFTKGFYLTVVDEDNNFQTYAYYPDNLTHLGLLNFVEKQSSKDQYELMDAPEESEED